MTDLHPYRSVALSVIVPTYNARTHLRVQLDAIASQCFDHPWEVVIADNGSTDGTRDLVKAMASTFPVPLRVVDASARKGACSARNAGAVASRGQALLFCDADDMVAPGWVEHGWHALQQDDMVGGLTRELRDPHEPDAPPIRPSILVGRPGMESVISSNLGVRRRAFFTAGGFDESLPPYGVHDIEFSLRMRKSGHTIAASPEMIVYFRRTTDPMVLARKIYRSGRTETLVWDRHPQLYPQRRDRSFVVRHFARFPVDAARGVLRDRRIDAPALARDFLTRAGHAAAYRPGGVRARTGPPQLLSRADDPMNAAVPHPEDADS